MYIRQVLDLRMSVTLFCSILLVLSGSSYLSISSGIESHESLSVIGAVIGLISTVAGVYCVNFVVRTIPDTSIFSLFRNKRNNTPKMVSRTILGYKIATAIIALSSACLLLLAIMVDGAEYKLSLTFMFSLAVPITCLSIRYQQRLKLHRKLEASDR